MRPAFVGDGGAGGFAPPSVAAQSAAANAEAAAAAIHRATPPLGMLPHYPRAPTPLGGFDVAALAGLAGSMHHAAHMNAAHQHPLSQGNTPAGTPAPDGPSAAAAAAIAAEQFMAMHPHFQHGANHMRQAHDVASQHAHHHAAAAAVGPG